MMISLILFLLRKRFHLKKYEKFRFNNQKDSKNYYFFSDDGLIKYSSNMDYFTLANVSLNWLLSKKCEVESFGYDKQSILALEVTYRLYKVIQAYDGVPYLHIQ